MYEDTDVKRSLQDMYLCISLVYVGCIFIEEHNQCMNT